MLLIKQTVLILYWMHIIKKSLNIVIFPMHSNKKPQKSPLNSKLKLLESPYICGKDHGYPSNKHIHIATKPVQRLKIDEIIAKKLDTKPKKIRLQSLQNDDEPYKNGTKISKTLKLSPIKQVKTRIRENYRPEQLQLTEQEKLIKLKVFLDNKDLLIEHWKKKERTQKQTFLSRLKIAGAPNHQSSQKFSKKKELKRSLKNINEKQFRIQPKQRKTSSKFYPNASTSKNPQTAIQDLQLEMERYYIENLLNLMQESKKSLLKDKKQLSKKIKTQEKDLKMNSKRELVRQIEEDLLRDHANRQQQMMDNYRRELEEELERQLYSERINQKYVPQDLENNLNSKRQQIKVDKSIQKDGSDDLNPEKPLEIKIKRIEGKSKSMVELNVLQNSVVSNPIEGFSDQQRNNVIKMIERRDPTLLMSKNPVVVSPPLKY